MRRKIFMLLLLVVAAPLLFGFGVFSAENWPAGTSMDFDDDDLRAELFPVSGRLALQGPVVNRVAVLALLLSCPSFHPPA